MPFFLFFFILVAQASAVFYPYEYLKKLSYNVYYAPSTGEITYTKGKMVLRFQLGQSLFFIGPHAYRFESPLRNFERGHALSNKDGELFVRLFKHYEKIISPSFDQKDTVVFLPKNETDVASLENVREKIFAEIYDGDIISPLHNFSKRIDTIIIDAGHGGSDPGAMWYGYREKDLTLQFSKDLQQVLVKKIRRRQFFNRANSVKIIQTRTKDQDMALEARAHYANKSLSQENSGLFISLHFNAWFNSSPRGLEVYYLGYSLDHHVSHHNRILGEPWRESENIERIFTFLEVNQFQKESRFLGKLIVDNVVKKNIDYPIGRGVRSGLFYVLRGVWMPSLLVEFGFLSNKEDMIYLSDDKNRKKLIEIVADSIIEYIDYYKETKGFTDKTPVSLN